MSWNPLTKCSRHVLISVLVESPTVDSKVYHQTSWSGSPTPTPLTIAPEPGEAKDLAQKVGCTAPIIAEPANVIQKSHTSKTDPCPKCVATVQAVETKAFKKRDAERDPVGDMKRRKVEAVEAAKAAKDAAREAAKEARVKGKGKATTVEANVEDVHKDVEEDFEENLEEHPEEDFEEYVEEDFEGDVEEDFEEGVEEESEENVEEESEEYVEEDAEEESEEDIV